MSRLNSSGSFGELGPGDLEMLLLRLKMSKERGKDRVVLRDLPKNPGGRDLRATPSIPMSVVQGL